MSIYVGLCPCCGKDIGFDPKAEEYVCIHCGAKLKTAALKGEPAGGAPNAGDAPGAEAAENAEGELTDEQVTKELIRKAGFKSDLKKVEKQIDELRGKRTGYESRLKALRSLTVIGIVLAAAAAAIVAIFADNSGDGPDLSLIIAGIMAAAALFTLILSEVRRRDVKKQRARLEENILVKKQERDILIGRLNKINKRLHIHGGGK